MALYRNLDSANKRIDDLFHRNQAMIASLLSAQRKLRRIEAILQGMQWNGRGVSDPYANWLRGQLELALAPEEAKESPT
ncbi:MAG TPA: hypothetical protein VNM48_10635 [Chloroflexota bacterium]|nr:hypothetical protein [Chloroflexota bacterium]